MEIAKVDSSNNIYASDKKEEPKKRNFTNKNVAFIHFISVASGSLILTYIFSLLIGAVFFLLNKAGLDFFDKNGVSYLIFPLGIIMGTWLSVRFSADNLNRNYAIQDIQKAITLSTIYMIVAGTPFLLFASILGPTAPSLSVYVFMFTGFIIMLVTFYVISKKYIKNDELAIPKYIIDKKINTIISIIIIVLVTAVAVIVVLPKIMEAIEIGTF